VIIWIIQLSQSLNPVFILNLLSRYWLLATLLLATTIAALSLWPLAALPVVPGSDKTHHFIAYATLMMPVALIKRERLIFYYLGFLCFSGAIELLQPYVNRYCDWRDLLANGLGLLCGWLLALSFRSIWRFSSR
jgi:hypothetical protein